MMMTLYESGVRPAIDAWLLEKSKEKRDYGLYWSASSSGYCMRKVIFERLGVPHVTKDSDARKQRVFTAGHLFHSWIQEITKKAGLSIAQEVELQDEDLMIRGHIDDLIAIEYGDDKPATHLILYDYKTQNSKAFNYKRSDMSHYHRMQLGTYMYMLRKMGKTHKYREAGFPEYDGKKFNYKDHNLKNLMEARILKMDKDTLRMVEEQLFWSPALEKEVYSYWSTLNGYWRDKKIPKCTCADFEGGFLAREAWNPYFYEGEPCSLAWMTKWRKENDIQKAQSTN